jgi:thiamine-phosphate pyrophosphorylase
MHRMSPGVERALSSARAWAERGGSERVLLSHFVLALLDEDEGRPAVLLERAGVNVAEVRAKLGELGEVAAAPAENVLFAAARAWSLARRHDPEFLTDAFLLAVLRADPNFARSTASLGLDATQLEQLLIGPPATSPAASRDEEHTLAVFATPTTVEMDAGRILDANFNRAREAARVLEDYCRFTLDDRYLTQQLKELRHALAVAAQGVPATLLLSARETMRDVGISVTASGEYERASPAEVAVVNLKRLQESLRSLEEFGKVLGPELGREIEALRYRAYTLERAIVAGGRARERLAGAKLYVLVTGGTCASSLDWTIAQAAAGGAEIIQLREKSRSDKELLIRARDVRLWTRQAGVLFIVNDRPDIARLVEADGVHLGQDDLPVKDARRIVGPDALVGVSTHTLEQVRRAVLDGADYIGIGPVFPSRTKEFAEFPGLEFVRAASAETSLPAFALGGIGPENVARVVATGARRVAVSTAVVASDEPQRAARRLREALA